MAKKKASGKSKVDPGMKAILEREPGLKTTLEQIDKTFGDGAIMPLGASQKLSIDGVQTGSLSLDMALGGQGIPRGRMIEVFGPESSGKTTLALHIGSEAQKKGGIAAIIDAEHAFDPSWAKKIGVEL
ncbi:MAG: DNA recombination/repair protein RecA, partial [Planctomycetota bacterium]